MQNRAERVDAHELWRSLHYFNLYRFTVAGVFVATFVTLGPVLTYGADRPLLFFVGCTAYLTAATLFTIPISFRWPRLETQLTAQVFTDVSCIVLLMYASGGMKSGFGILLLINLVAASLIGRGRMVLFYSAMASIAVLLEQTYRVVEYDQPSFGFLQAGFLSMAFFAVAWLSHSLVRRLMLSERQAKRVTVDLENLAQVNQLVIQDMADAVLVVDESGTTRQWNQEAAKLLGPMEGRQPLERCFPALAAWFRKWWADPNDRFTVVRTPSGKDMQIRAVLVGEREEPHGAVIFMEDVGKLRSQAQQFKLAALGRLTASIAHEIRNPLSSISYAAELLAEEEGLSSTGQRLIHIIRDNGARLEKMVQDILQLNRRDRTEPVDLNLEEFITDFLEEYRQAERLSEDFARLEVPSGLTLRFDRVHLGQVLWNLSGNGWRHGRRQAGSLRFSAGRSGLHNRPVWLEVADDGPGVPEDIRQQLFEPFFTTAAQGTGLGLYVAREICEVNGATLDYVSRPGEGGVFRITGKGGVT